MHYLLFYEKVPDFATRQAPLLPAHSEHVMKAARGAMALAGSLGNPDDGTALMLFECGSAEMVEAFAKSDPYVTGGVIHRWTVRTWDLVVGAEKVAPATQPSS